MNCSILKSLDSFVVEYVLSTSIKNAQNYSHYTEYSDQNTHFVEVIEDIPKI